MPFTLEIKDTSGVENLIQFDFRDSASPNVFYDIRTFIKIQFEECIADVISMFPQNNLLFSVNLEQEKKNSQSNVLACFDTEKSTANILYFRIYYDSILQLATCLTQSDGADILKQFKSTLYHELMHAADLGNLKEQLARHDHDFNEHENLVLGAFFDANQLSHQVNVQWALLHFFSKFRAEGIAILGEKLLSNNFGDNVVEKTSVFKSFNETLHRVLEICSGLQFFNNFENHDAVIELDELSLSAYIYADLLFIHALQKQEIVEDLRFRNPEGPLSFNDRQGIIEVMKVFIETDLSEFIQLLLSLPELNFREKFLHLCAVIQREGDPNTISDFSRHLLWAGYNKDNELFIKIIQKSMGSKMPLSEMIDMHHKFLQKSYQEDIIEDIRKMSEVLMNLAQASDNEVALWALTYLFDDQDLIHDDISYLGWQDDWVVLDSAMRILHLN
jgi:uncharacterized membrane protein YkvA (DUF1232 family)